MSAMEEKITTKDEDNAPKDQDTSNQNIGSTSEGNAKSINPDIIGAKSKNVLQSKSVISDENNENIQRQSGDSAQKITTNSDKTHLIDKAVKTDSGDGSGDHTTRANDKDKEFNAKASPKDVTDKTEPKTGNYDSLVDEFTDDDDMELRWDDDDGNNQVTTDNEKPGMNKLEDILSEEEFFDENEIVTKNSPHQDEAEKSNLNDKLNTNKLEDIESEEEFLEETDTNAKHSKAISNTVILMQKTIAKEKALEDILSEEEFLEEPDGNAEISRTFPGSDSSAGKSKSNDQDALEGIPQSKVNTEKLETDIALEDSVDNINADTSPIRKENVEEELLKEPDINLEQNVKTKNADTIKSNLDTVRENSKDMAEDILLKENKSKTTAADMDITIEESLDNTIEAELLQETDTNPEEKETTQESEQNTAKDIEESDNKILEETLLEETETVKTSEINPDADLMNEDLLLEDKLLEEPKTITKDISVVDAPELEKVINTGVVENEDTILEDKLLEETEVIGEIPDEDVSMEKVDDQQEEELLKDDQDESCTAMDVDNTDLEANKDQEIGSNKIEKTIENLEETEIQTDLNRSEVQIKDLEKTTLEDKSEPDTTIIETITKDGIPLNTSAATEQKSDNPTKSPEDSPVRIKTDHSLHKPDVMLEIPTQELIDIDDTDLSMNLDQSEAFNSPNDVDKTICEDDIVNEKTVDQKAVVNETIVDKDSTDATTVDNVEKSTENVKERIKNVVENIDIVDNSNQNEEESIDIAKINENVDKSIENPEKSTETANKAIEDVEKNAKNVKSIENAEKNIENTEKTTENVEKSIHNIENRTDDIRKSTENIDKGADSVEKIAKDSIEESLERMFADNDHTAVEEVVECKASTSQTPDVTPSTSNKMTPDTSDEVPEVSDSLGLLAESSGRVMEDDEEPEDDDDGDDDDDFDQDESSNQISAEQSEDSNPPPSETEPARDEKEIDTPEAKEDEFQFTISNIESKSQDKLDTIMDIEVEEEKVEMPVHAANDDETQSAVEALLKDVEGPSTEENKDTAQQQMDIETVKLSDTSDTEADDIALGTPTEDQLVPEQSKMEIEEKEDKTKQSPSKVSPTKQMLITQSPSKPSPSKMKKLEITTLEASSVVNIVDLEESSSSEDDIQEVPKQPEMESPQSDEKQTTPEREDVTNVNIPTGIEIMCTSGGNTSEIVTKEGEVVISGVPKPPPHKPARLNTSEVSIKTVASAEPLVIPETKMNEPSESDTKSKTKLSLEIFSLDSDDDEGAAKEKLASSSPIQPAAEEEEEKPSEVKKCINDFCTSGGKETFIVADAAAMAYYDARRKRRAMLCLPCADVLAGRTKKLIQGIKDMTPLMKLEMGKLAQDLVEISDSESEDEDPIPEEPKESIGETGAKFLEENLTALMNETWRKYNLDVRLRETQIMLDDEIEKLEQDSREIDAMLSECQVATDKLRSELYATFEHRRQETPALCIYDTPEQKYIVPEIEQTAVQADVSVPETRQAKRRLSSTSDAPAKRPAIPLGYAPLDADTSSSAKEPKPATTVIENKMDDDKDISVVKLSAEAAPADLPPPGELARPALRVGMPVYAMKNAFGPWLKGRILEMQPKNPNSGNSFTVCRVKFDHKTKTNGKVLPARCIAYAEPADVRMTIGTRLIALFKDSNKRESYYSGVVAEIPNPVNNYRYLVFFDDGYAQYVQHAFTRLVCEYSPLVWEEVHPFSREFVREYLLAYPERPMVRLHEGQHLKTEWNGKWWSSLVTKVDASLAQVRFLGDGRREWVYRGSTRLAPLYLELRAAERHRPRPMPRSKAQPRLNMPYVEYTRSDEPDSNKQPDTQTQQQQNEEIRRQRAVAKKSTTVAQVAPPPQQHPVVPGNLDTVTSRVVYYTPKNAVKPYKMVPHKCGPKCKRTDVLTLKELRTYNPLAKPLLSGWERQIVRFKGHKEVMYRAPCGRRVRSVRELHAYLRAVASDLPVDLFDFHHATHCLAEFVLNKCLVGKKDLSHGKENVPVPCVNYYDDSLPEFCSYNTERTPTAGVPLNLDPEFLCGCDCTDDCQDKSKCACWKMTLEGARTIGLHGPNVGYVYKRLPEPLPSGIYECNSRCKCKHTCLNRVAQHPLQLKLQVFKTLNRGWGIRALNDVPKGSFLCVYAGNLLTDATANLDGLNEGDEYLAELDYIEVVEQMKEGYEEDIPEADKKLDKKEGGKDGDDDDDEEPSSSEDEDTASKTDKEDDDFRPGYIGLGVTEFNKRLRRREKNKKEKEEKPAEEKEKDKETKETSANPDEDCITISDDEEVREPSRFTVQAGMGANEFISKYKSVRTLFGKDEACYIMDAKVQGNIGRYLNHSCCPNVFVQNVFVDTHDPRFPWVAFFALSHIKAGTELTWNYNYDVGSVPGKILYCFCGAPNCRGRLL